MSLRPNDILDDQYRIERVMVGGQGTVYLAVDLHGRDKQRFAVKRPKESGAEHVQAFLAELKMYQAVRFPGIPRYIKTVRDQDDLPHGVFEYLEGDDLSKRLLDRGGPFDEATLRDWAGQLLQILEHLHERKNRDGKPSPIIHADIKPGNLKVDAEGQLWLLDFGLSRNIGTVTFPHAALEKSVRGSGYTAHYAPPEQIEAGRMTVRSDYYAFGATFYRLATNQLPPSATERKEDLKEGSPDPLLPARELNPALSESFSRTLSACLNLERDRRPKSVTEIRAMLENARHFEPSATQPDQSRTIPERSVTIPDPRIVPVAPSPVAEPSPSTGPVFAPGKKGAGRPSGLLWTGLVLGVICVALGLGWYFELFPDPSPEVTKHEIQFVAETLKMPFVSIPKGRFQMGSTPEDGKRWQDKLKPYDWAYTIYLMDEMPVHEVRFEKPFEMGQFEVTQAQWRMVAEQLPQVKIKLESRPSYFKDCDNCPVEQVSWDQCQEFLERLNALDDGFQYRLPSEAEWEYACRAKENGDYSGPDLTALGWFYDNSGDKPLDGFKLWKNIDNYIDQWKKNQNRTRPIGGKSPNEFKLHDMHGNVWEWCEDTWHDNYKDAPGDGSAWTSGGTKDRVARGGSWSSYASNCRSASRDHYAPDYSFNDFGFRVVRVPRT